MKPLLKRVTLTKSLAAATAYTAGDVLSESATTGTDWDFAAIGGRDGASGYIVGAIARSESEGVTPRLTLFLFNAAPANCVVNDNAANTCLDAGDAASFIGRIDFPAMTSPGTSDSVAVATVSTYGNLPIPFVCATNADDLFGILITNDAFTQTATDDMAITLIVENNL